MKALQISDGKSLPIDVITEALGVLARRGRGKSYTASVLAEEMLDRGVQVVVVDPTGAWWGLRSSADGSGDGYPVIIMGGEHGDVPLEPTAGTVVADFVVQEGFPVVLDLSLFESRADEIRFMTAFAERLYRAKKKNTGVLHLIVDEASVFVPQNVKGDVARMVGAMEAIVRRGRIKGLGCTLIDQRPASVNKNVLTQAKGLIVLGVSSPQDRKAIRDWVDARGADIAATMIDELPSLGLGTAYVWLPDLGIFEKVQIRKRKTFDSSATPKPGEKVLQPKSWSTVDLEAVSERMSSTIEKAKATDPALLRKRIAELEKELRKRPTETEVVEKEVVVEVPVVGPDVLDRVTAAMSATQEGLKEVARLFSDVLQQTRPPKRTSTPITAPVSARKPPEPKSDNRTNGSSADVTPVAGAQQRILDALAWLEVVGIAPASRLQCAMVAGYHPRTKGFTNGLGTMRSSGLIDYPSSGFVEMTESGRGLANYPSTPPTSEELQRMIFEQVGPAKSRILAELIEVYPEAMSRVELAEALDYHERTKGFTNGLGSLRSLGLIDYPQPGWVRAEDVLFVPVSV